ncbi:MAG: triose-phosphate isomerase [bacterium]
MTKPLIIANWKLNMTQKQSSEFIKDFAEKVKASQNQVDIILSAPFTSLETVVKVLINNGLDKVSVASQNVSEHESGAFTGEINTEMLKEIGVKVVIVGHSERREIFNESNETIKAKSKKVLDAGLTLIFCCGESLETREKDETDKWIETQIRSAFSDLDFTKVENGQIVIAYEPIWAIGTGKTCDSVEANRVIQNIKDLIKNIFPAALANSTRVLYGGSVKPSTIEEQMAQTAIDGALVGGASLKANDFADIVNFSAKAVLAA